MERINAQELLHAGVGRAAAEGERMDVCGFYTMECRDADGNLKWTETFDNLVTTAGKNHLLDNYIAGSSFTQVGPFLGLISSVGYGVGPAAGDTMGSHAGWNEAGNGVNYPVWSTPASNARGTPSWNAASAGSKASNSVSFTIGATGGTVKGAFLVLGTGAVTTNNNGSGVLFSAGTFTGGDKVVATGDTLQVTYTLSA